jgi:hypothetical protein
VEIIVFDLVALSDEADAIKAEVLAALAEHGLTSPNIPPGFQSPLYFKSIYYQRNVKEQRWINLKEFLMCANYLYNWSVENQIESEYYRSLPSDLTGAGYFVAHCCFHVDGGYFANRICRLITQFYGGFNEGKVKHPIVLTGMPKFGKNDHTLPRCSHCDKEYSDASGGTKLCCGRVYYCRDGDCRRRDLRNHETSCVCDEVLKRREVAAALEEARKKAYKTAEDNAAAAAASLLAELPRIGG